MSRSGSPYSAPRDANHVPLLVAASTADGITPVVLEADPSTHALVTSGGGTGGGGTQYTDQGVVAALPTGNALIYFDNSNTPNAVKTSQPLPVIGTASLTANGFISAANSSTTNLAGGASFTGTSENVTNYSAIQVYAFSSHASATDGLSLQQSSDGTNWDVTDTYTITATTGKAFSVQPATTFFRLVYTNGATLTTSLRIKVVYHIIAPNPSSQRTSDAYTNETDLTQNWAFNSIWNGTTWDRIKSIATGIQGVGITDGTNIANVVAGDSGFNGVSTASATKTYTFTTSASGAQNLLANTPTEGFTWIEVVYSSVGVGLALTGQFATASGGTYVSSSSFGNSVGVASTSNIGTVASTLYGGPIRGNFFQLAVSALTSGTFAGTVTLRALAPPLATLLSVQSGTWNIGGATSAAMADAFVNPTNNSVAALNDVFNGTTWDRQRSVQGIADSVAGIGLAAMGGYVYNGATWEKMRGDLGDASSPTGVLVNNPLIYNGSTYDRLRSGGVQGMMGVSIQASPTGAFTYGHVSTAATTTLKSGAGTLHNVSVNTLGTVASTATIYDSTTGSGTVIGVINTLNLSGSFILDVAFTTGLTIVTTGTIAPDLTVSYK